MVLCEICKTPFRCINGEYICQEGHVSSTKVEIADDVHWSIKSQKHKVKKEKSIFSKYCLQYKSLVIASFMFDDIVSFMNCKSTKFMDYYLNFFSGDKSIVNSPIRISFGYLLILAYFTKRLEEEKKGNLLFYASFLIEFKKFDYLNRCLHYKNILDMKGTSNIAVGVSITNIYWIRKYKLVSILSEAKFPVNKEHARVIRETSCSHPLIEYNKAVMRQDFDSSIDFMLKYFYEVCKIYAITVTEDMIKYYKRYAELRRFSRMICIPEDEISMYLYLYCRHKAIEIDHKKALENINKIIGNTNFDTSVEYEKSDITFLNLITLFTHTSEQAFIRRLQDLIMTKEFRSKNNIFIVTSNFTQHYQLLKKESFIHYIKLIKHLLENKMNYKIKKRYIEDDRI
ncbi:hypothetical protein P3W45_001277 [Vairimorpha bombi]|jgi:hypothetical protein